MEKSQWSCILLIAFSRAERLFGCFTTLFLLTFFVSGSMQATARDAPKPTMEQQRLEDLSLQEGASSAFPINSNQANTPPTITLSQQNSLFRDFAGLQQNFLNVSITAPDNVNFDGGLLRVSMAPNSSSGNEFFNLWENDFYGGDSLIAGASVLARKDVSGTSVNIGTLVNSLKVPSTDLLIALNGNATPESLHDLFKRDFIWGMINSGASSLGTRTFTVTLTDANGVQASSTIDIPLIDMPRTATLTPTFSQDVAIEYSSSSLTQATNVFEFELNTAHEKISTRHNIEEFRFTIHGDFDVSNLEFRLDGPIVDRQLDKPHFRIDGNTLSIVNTIYRMHSDSLEFSLKAWFKDTAIIDDTGTLRISIDADSGISLDSSMLANQFAETEPVSSGIITSAGPPTELRFAQIPTIFISGEKNPRKIIVHATDPSGNLDTDFNGKVTISLSASDTGTLSGTTTIASIDGIATFDDLIITSDAVGEEDATLIATATGISGSAVAQIPTVLITEFSPEISIPQDSSKTVISDTVVPQRILDSLRISDIDSPNFDRGQLHIKIRDGFLNEGESLILADKFQSGFLRGDDVIINGSTIGSVLTTMGSPGDEITINFNENATPDLVEAFINESLKYRNISLTETSSSSFVVDLTIWDLMFGNFARASTPPILVRPKDKNVEFESVNLTSSDGYPILFPTSSVTAADQKKLFEFKVRSNSATTPWMFAHKIQFSASGNMDPANLDFYLESPTFFPKNESIETSRVKGQVSGRQIIFDYDQGYFWIGNGDFSTFSVYATYKTTGIPGSAMEDLSTLSLSLDPNDDIFLFDSYDISFELGRVSNAFPELPTYSGAFIAADITATQLQFTQLPAQLIQNDTRLSTVSISATDPAGRTDIDIVDEVSLAAIDIFNNPVAFSGATSSTTINGTATFSNIGLTQFLADGSSIYFVSDDTAAGLEGDLNEVTSVSVRAGLPASIPTVSLRLEGDFSVSDHEAKLSTMEETQVVIVAEIKDASGDLTTLDFDVTVPLEFIGDSTIEQHFAVPQSHIVIPAGASSGRLQLSSTLFPVSDDGVAKAGNLLTVGILNGQLVNLREATEQSAQIRFYNDILPEFIRTSVQFSGQEDTPGLLDLSGSLLINELNQSVTVLLAVYSGTLSANQHDANVSVELESQYEYQHNVIKISGLFSEVKKALNDAPFIMFSPYEDLNGEPSVYLSFSDPGFLQNDSTSVSIAPVNDAPVISGTPALQVLEGQQYSFIPRAHDIDYDSLSFSAVNLPSWASISTRYGEILGTPDFKQSGVYSNIVVTVSDGELSASLEPFSIEVVNSNTAPVIANVDANLTFSMNEDTSIGSILTATDNEDSNLTWQLITAASNGTASTQKRNPTDTEFSYVPNANFHGTDFIELEVNDGLLSDTVTVNFNVLPVDDAPTISGSPQTTVNETQSYSFIPTITNVDNDILTFSSLNLPVWLNMNSTTGQITGSPGYLDAGIYSGIQIMVSDGQSSVPFGPFNIEVVDVNAPPSVDIGNSISISVTEDTTATINLKVTDPDNDELSWSIVTEPSLGRASVSGDNVAELVFVPNVNESGVDTFSISVSDGASVVQLLVTIDILPVNDAPTISGAPTLEVQENISYSFIPVAVDVEEDILTFSAQNLPEWLQIDANTGELSGMPAEKHIGLSENITLSVSDGEHSASLELFSIEVLRANEKPTLAVMSAVTTEDIVLTLTLHGSDDDGDSLSYSVATGPENGTIEIVDDVLSYSPNENFFGSENVTIQAYDGFEHSDPAPLNIDVTPVNDAPVISGVPTIQISEGEHYLFMPEVFDPDSPDLIYSLINGPSWLNINTQTGELSNEVPQNAEGNYSDITISVSDGEFTAALTPYNLIVDRVNVAPQIQPLNLKTEEDTSIAVDIDVIDADGDELVLDIASQGKLGVATISANRLHYVPAENANGIDQITIGVDDGELKTLLDVDIEILSINDLPNATNDSFILQINSKGEYTLNVLENDSDVDTLTNSDRLSIDDVKSSIGVTTVIENQILLTTDEGFAGEVLIDYSVNDLQGSTDNARVAVNINAGIENSGLNIELPEDIAVNATGLLTEIDLGEATATRADGEQVQIRVLRDDLFFAPGLHSVNWQVNLENGDVINAVQEVQVFPIVSLTPEIAVTEGKSAEIEVFLNGQSPVYPLSISYFVEGTAELEDHNLSEGTITIESGVAAKVSFDTFADDVSEGTESIVVTLDEALNSPEQSSTQVSIVENAIAPQLVLVSSQEGVNRTTVSQQNGPIKISSHFATTENMEIFRFTWHLNGEVLLGEEVKSISIEPIDLIIGNNSVALEVVNSSFPELATLVDLTFVLIERFEVLSALDQDNDFILDLTEGHQDSDFDGIVDYLDANSRCNVIPLSTDIQERFLVQSNIGNCLRLGNVALDNDANGLSIPAELFSLEQVEQQFNLINLPLDFEVNRIKQLGGNPSIVIPLDAPLAQDAWYRIRKSDSVWEDFIVDESNQLYTAMGVEGICPEVDSQTWILGAVSGNWCLKLELSDGGPNDVDGIQNYIVKNLGGVALPASVNRPPVANDDFFNIREGDFEVFEILVNDLDPDGDSISLDAINASFGTANINSDQSITYFAPDNFSGDELLTYSISDGNGGSAIAKVNVSIIANQRPIVSNDFVEVNAISQSSIDVLENDSDPEGDELTIKTASAKRGSVSIQENVIVYTINTNESGSDLIRYTISDSYGATANGTVTVSILDN